MSTILGNERFSYRVVRDWARLPDGWRLMDVAGIGVDQSDRVYVFNRGEHPMVVFDREGNFLRSWGEDIFSHAHGIHMAPDDTIYCTDDGDHTVRRMSLDGKMLMQIALPERPSPFMSGRPFNKCTHTALSPKGDIFVSDGYGNAAVHKFSPDGRLLKSWGEPGCSPGEFNVPHNICCDADGWVYVADRENHRVQVFDSDGRFETQWNSVHRPSGLYMTAGQCPLCYIGEIGPYLPVNRHFPNLGPRITITTNRGEVLARLGRYQDAAGQEPGQFMSPHGIAVDSHGDLYVGEVSYSAWPSLYPGKTVPSFIRSLQKLVRVTEPAPADGSSSASRR